ncbi:jg24261, partial [Pararge aegeria aegeria]
MQSRATSSEIKKVKKKTYNEAWLTACLFPGDVILCTLPLGVLKVAVANNGTNQQNFVKFDPPLPDWK